jgi:AP-3 complex subunit mu
MQSGAPVPDSNPTINLKFTINQMVVSGIKVNRLDMYGEVRLKGYWSLTKGQWKF